MTPLVLGSTALTGMLILVALGLPVGVAMGITAFVGLWFATGGAFLISTLETLPFAITNDYAFLVIPMFVFLGTLSARTGMTTEIFDAAQKWTSSFKGSLYYATTLAAGGFGAINGSTVVSSALFSRMALPEMEKHGYSAALSAGCICAAGTFAALIPPSIAMVVYALITSQSVGVLLLAGLMPGLLTILIYVIGLFFIVRIWPSVAPQNQQPVQWSEKLASLKGLWAFCLVMLVVIGGIYSGVMFPSSAGAAGVTGLLIISLLRRNLSGVGLKESLRQAAVVTGTLFVIIIGGLFLSRFLLISGFIGEITSVANRVEFAPFQLILGVVLIFLILGMFIDGLSLMVMAVPILHPIAVETGLNPVWFGVIVIKMIEIGAITPPVGLNLFAVLGASEGRVKAAALFRGVLPFILLEVIILGLLIGAPQISLWLPDLVLN